MREVLDNGIDELNSFVSGGKFSISKAYRIMQPTWPKVPWKQLVLLKGLVPKHQFILLLAIQRRLATADRQKWGIQAAKECVLCETDAVETIDHLFFQCSHSQFIWKILLSWMGLNKPIGSWEDEVAWMAQRTTRRNPLYTALGITFAATVYHTWIERNTRRFQQQKRPKEEQVREIVLMLHTIGQNCK
ncbi:uncharacterized protein LOC132611336 [Lycium barbarum]|uniref:uncharacterized protein LOC132611336 n=1 Tax=Lycium barbarum TaxID=112863 RepID=UPI00293E2D62|nr:uncharacterized protein LOC132611336 [Lycium barbarum]